MAEIGAEDRIAIIVDRKIAPHRPPEACAVHGQNIFRLSVDCCHKNRIDPTRKGFLYLFAKGVTVGTLSVGIDEERFFDQFVIFGFDLAGRDRNVDGTQNLLPFIIGFVGLLGRT